ncbi:E3 ubiquitin-protein ligase PUB24-like [Diospyros lotus]|uniref:E3 ubiquitin-protein ligase PUB24-like n=1 Tax=Diospyros lotus TaxID=55363 RepID=UPI0022588F4C|nr:E3 ubiquitin-protein ligase PUB24-like [Diospyros lotus]
MDEIEVPQYFICPISLQVMKDPVTAITGITYDRESIEHWLFKAKNTTCPVTKQRLPRDTVVTPNHILRRMIQTWTSSLNGCNNITSSRSKILVEGDLLSGGNGLKVIDKHPLHKAQVFGLIGDLWFPKLQIKTLRRLEALAVDENGIRNRKLMVKAGAAKAVAFFVARLYKAGETKGLEEALRILYLLQVETNLSLPETEQIIDSLTWVLGLDIDDYEATVKSHAVLILKTIVEKASSSLLEMLKPEFFQRILSALRKISQQAIKAACQVMLDACPWGRNRIMMVESGAVSELIELELGSPEKRTTELIMGVLFHLCSSADGRAQLLSHAAGIAVITKRILKVSPAADDRAMAILSMVCKFSGTASVLQEMLRLGTITKLCLVLQVECAMHLKDKAKEILRAHSVAWKNSPCVEITTLLSTYLG